TDEVNAPAGCLHRFAAGASVLSESHTLTRCTQLESVGSATGREPDYSNFQLADGEGFEPPRPLRAFRFSRPAPSTTRPPIRLVLPGLCASKDGVGHLAAQRRKKACATAALPYGARTHVKARRCVNVSAVICQAALARNAPRDQLGNAP